MESRCLQLYHQRGGLRDAERFGAGLWDGYGATPESGAADWKRRSQWYHNKTIIVSYECDRIRDADKVRYRKHTIEENMEERKEGRVLDV